MPTSPRGKCLFNHNTTVNPTAVRADVGIGPYGAVSTHVHNATMLIKADSLKKNLAISFIQLTVKL